MWAALHGRWYLIRRFLCPRCLRHLALAPSVSCTPIRADQMRRAYLVESFLNLICKKFIMCETLLMNYDTHKKWTEHARGRREPGGKCGLPRVGWAELRETQFHYWSWPPKSCSLFSCPFLCCMKWGPNFDPNAKNYLFIFVSQVITIVIRSSQTISITIHKPHPLSNSTVIYVQRTQKSCWGYLYVYTWSILILFFCNIKKKPTCFFSPNTSLVFFFIINQLVATINWWNYLGNHVAGLSCGPTPTSYSFYLAGAPPKKTLIIT